MAQFDVFSLPDGSLVVDVQSDYAAVYGTRLVIPLVQPDGDAAKVPRLNPSLLVNGEPVLLATQLASAVREKFLRSSVASLADDDFTIKAALDFLISGF